MLAFGRIDNLVIVYDLATRKIVSQFEAFQHPGAGVTWVSFSPRGDMIAAGTASFETLVHGPNGKTEKVPPDPGTVRIFRTANGANVASFAGRLPGGSEGQWSPAGPYIAITGEWDLYIWNPFKPGSAVNIAGLRRGGFGLAFSPDGSCLAVNNGPSVTIFDLIHKCDASHGGTP